MARRLALDKAIFHPVQQPHNMSIVSHRADSSRLALHRELTDHHLSAPRFGHLWHDSLYCCGRVENFKVEVLTVYLLATKGGAPLT